ncbi:MAG: hypothetical protein Q4A66_13245 [Eubacteriales bacterium]|nr:hypothetical protein [Eubacteriales bacterium]
MKKILAFMLAAMLLLMPGLSLAENEMRAALDAGRAYNCDISLRMIDGLLDAETTALLNSLGLSLGAHGGQLSAALTGGGQTLIDGTAEMTDDALYLASGMAPGALRIGADTLPALLDMTCNYLISRGYATQEQIDQLKAELSAGPVVDVNLPATVAGMDLADIQLNTEPLEQAVMAILSKVETMPAAEYADLPEAGDPAETVMLLTLTPEDVSALIGAAVETLKSDDAFVAALDAELAAQGVTFAQIEAQLPAVYDALNVYFAKGLSILAGMDANGAPVCLYVSTTLTDGAEPIGFNYDYHRVTENGEIFYLNTLSADVGGETVFDAYFSFLSAAEENAFSVGAQADGEAFDLTGIATPGRFDLILSAVEDGETVSLGLGCTMQEGMLDGGADAFRETVLTFYVSMQDGETSQEIDVAALTIREETGEPTGESIVTGDAFRPESIPQETFDSVLDALVALSQEAA